MACYIRIVVLLALAISSTFSLESSSESDKAGTWTLLKRNIGISAMHMALLPNDRIITFDRTSFGPSNITFPIGKCPKQTSDCYVHSVEFDPATQSVRSLTVLTDTWCSSGALSADGILVQTGGYNYGERVVRYLKPGLDSDWTEDPNGLVSPRWYASNQILPNGNIIIFGGRRQFSYEFIPKISNSDYREYQLPFLKQTRYSDLVPNNLYPFLHLCTDGNLFVFANDDSILLDYTNNKVLRNYPTMPGGVSRNYPSTGSSVLLPLDLSANNTVEAEVFVCGGTTYDANEKANAGMFVPASKTCGRLIITLNDPKWEIEAMPIGRVMGDMILLPTGDVLIINGAAKGSAGWGVAREPVLNPVLYRCNEKNTDRFEIMSPSTIPRLYHSTAHLLSDGRVLVGGSNPNKNYNFSTLYPTELSLEAFNPPYLDGSKPRPTITSISPGIEITYKQRLSIGFQLNGEVVLESGKFFVTMVSPSFTTHSFAMNQRVLVLKVDQIKKTEAGIYGIDSYAPATGALAPPGYYQLFVIHDGVPSRAKWVHIKY